MNKIKLLLPASLSMIAGVAIPLVSCGGGGNTINYTVDSFKDEAGPFMEYGYESQPQTFKKGNTYKYNIDLTKIDDEHLDDMWNWNVATYEEDDITDNLDIKSIKLTLDDEEINFFDDPSTVHAHDPSIYPCCVNLTSMQDVPCYSFFTKDPYSEEGKHITDFDKLTIQFTANETKSNMQFFFVDNK